jgi:hypothetical protein
MADIEDARRRALGKVISVAEVKDGLAITVLFTSDEDLRTALNIVRNLGKVYADLHDDHLMVGIGTGDFYDGP